MDKIDKNDNTDTTKWTKLDKMDTQCLKLTQNVAFAFLNFDIFHQFLSY